MEAPYCIVSRKGLARGLLVLGNIVQEANTEVLLTRGTFDTFCRCPLVNECLDKAATDKLFRTHLTRRRVKGRGRMFYPTFLPRRVSRLMRVYSRVMFGSMSRCLLRESGVRGTSGGVDIKLEVGPRYSARRKRRVCSPYTPNSELKVAESTLSGTVGGKLSLSHVRNFRFRALYRRSSSTLRAALTTMRRGFKSLLCKLG